MNELRNRIRTSAGWRVHGLIWCTLLLLFAQANVWSMEVPRASDSSEADAMLPEYHVGPGDVLSVQVFELDQLNQRITVSNSGKIHLPNLGVLTVMGMTAGEIERDITSQLVEKKLVKEPWVRVTVAEYHAQPVYVIGEVNQPGQFMITGEMHLLDAVSRAGGFSPAAGEEGYFLRRRYRPRVGANVHYENGQSDKTGTNSPEALAKWLEDVNRPEALGGGSVDPFPGETIKVDLKDLKGGGDTSLNFRLQGGDVFFVPRRQRQYIYIVGEVLFPGAYGLPPQYDHLTVSRVVAYAGGPLKTAKSGSAFIMRRDDKGEIIGVPFDFNAIIKGEKPDQAIQPDDILFVPRSVGKTIGYGMLDLVAHLTQQFIIF